ncbi:MerR family transcriptional regulator [Geobacillus stearothermophilus]|uniref:MerR family transcriptional regulator n=1 Tax=Geobacillus stearothermophilus TaxID=1422 RepID=UPI001E5C196E|nr:MerR family transcriptional regulator [Geobacillus stearothermophilus]MED4332514.1 MerR family transcriptional regulator [Geobacillus stearothermophilus]MED4995443.1 MerR family transcriptional regulator [Geobacillus stearothermophilus]
MRMKEYSTKDIANIVGIATPTVRKYAQALEKAGYTFIKNDQGFRIFSDNDVQIFERIKEMSNDTGMPVDRIASMLVSEQKNDASDPIRIESEVATPLENELKMIDESDIGRIDRQYEALLKEIQELKQIVIAQQKYIDERLNTRDELLLQSIRALQEQKRAMIEGTQKQEKVTLEIAATTEDKTTEDKRTKKQGWLSRIFGK